MIGGGHDQMQVMRDHEHGTAALVPGAGDQGVKLFLTGDVHALRGFVQHQQIGFAQQGARQQHALQLAAGKPGHRCFQDMAGADFLQGMFQRGDFQPRHSQIQKTLYVQGQGFAQAQLLRHITHTQAGAALPCTGVWLQQAESNAHQTGFAGTVGADQGKDLAGLKAQIDAVEHAATITAQAYAGKLQQGIRHEVLLVASGRLRPAMAAEAGQFQGLALYDEVGIERRFFHSLAEGAGVGDFLGIAAGFTEQEVAGMGGARMRAANKGITRGNAMDQFLLEQEFESAVNRGRRRLVAFGRELVEDLVGAQRAMTVPDQLQHAPAQWRQTGATLGAEAVGRGQGVVHAVAVIMGQEGVDLHGAGSRQRMCNNITSTSPCCIVRFAMFRALLIAWLLAFIAPSALAAEVLASIRPLALIAQAVAGDKANVQQLVPNGSSSHDYQLKPSDRQRLSRADIILWVGPAHEGFLQRSIAASRAVIVTAQKLPGIHLLAQRRPDGNATLPDTVDAHLWLDADNAVVIARALAEELAGREPAKAAVYRRNAAEFATHIALFKSRWAPRFQGLPSRSFIAYHDAYQYLEPMLGLNYRGSLVTGAEGKPSAKHFLLVSQKIRQEGIACFLGEPGFDAALARNVFAERRPVLATVDEQFAAAPSSAEGYEAGLGLMAENIYRCLGGS